MIVDVLQTCMIGTTVEYEIPDDVAKKGYEAVMDYIQEHYDEIPGGDIDEGDAFNWNLDYEATSDNVVEALKEGDLSCNTQ